MKKDTLSFMIYLHFESYAYSGIFAFCLVVVYKKAIFTSIFKVSVFELNVLVTSLSSVEKFRKSNCFTV